MLLTAHHEMFYWGILLNWQLRGCKPCSPFSSSCMRQPHALNGALDWIRNRTKGSVTQCSSSDGSQFISLYDVFFSQFSNYAYVLTRQLPS